MPKYIYGVVRRRGEAREKTLVVAAKAALGSMVSGWGAARGARPSRHDKEERSSRDGDQPIFRATAATATAAMWVLTGRPGGRRGGKRGETGKLPFSCWSSLLSSYGRHWLHGVDGVCHPSYGVLVTCRFRGSTAPGEDSLLKTA